MGLELQLETAPADKRVKAAIIVRLLRSLETDLSLSKLPQNSQIALARAMGQMGTVDRDTVNATIEEFTQAVDSVALPAPSGMRAALETLDGQLSPEVTDQMEEEAASNDPNHAWVRLARLDDEHLARIMGQESIEIASLLLSKLPVAQAARILTQVPGERARRIACITPQIDKMSVTAVTNIAQALANDHCNRSDSAFEVDAVARVGAILNSTGAERRDEVLGGLDEDDPDFALRVRRSIFVFENIPERIDPLDVPKITRTLDQEQLQVALAGALSGTPEEAAAAEFMLENMSKRLAQQIRDEIAASSPPRRSAVEEIHALLIGSIKDAIDSGEISPIEEDE